MQQIKTQKGITLIALIITIIVMLILVGVTISVSINGGLFSQARKAGSQTQIAAEMEILQAMALSALKDDATVDFNKLDELIETSGTFTKVGEKTYVYTDSERGYRVSEHADVEEEGPLKLRVQIDKDGNNQPILAISHKLPKLTEENITDRQTIDIIEKYFFLETTGIEGYQDLYEKCAQSIPGYEGITYEQILGAMPEGSTEKDVFIYLMMQASQMPDMEFLADIKTPQQLAIVFWQFEQPDGSDVTINDGEDTFYANAGEIVKYDIPSYGEYKIALEMFAIKDEITIAIMPKEDLGLEVKLSETLPLHLLISFDEIPGFYNNVETAKLSINGGENIVAFGYYPVTETWWAINSYGTYEVVLEIDGIQAKKTIEVKPPILKEDLLKVELSDTLPLKLLISYDGLPELYINKPKLYINGEDKTTLMGETQAEYIIPEYGNYKYEIVLELDGQKVKTVAETTGQEIAQKLNWDTSKIDIRQEEKRVVPVPKGFEVLKTAEKPQGYSTDEGLVITNGGNEFVWVPVTNPGLYTEESFGPLAGSTIKLGEESVKTDSYKTIQHYYGNALGTMNSDADFDAVFTYEADAANVQRSIRTYGGFYVGRYETTYDSTSSNRTPQGIGVKQGKDVLRAYHYLKPSTETKPASGENYFYRWWGLYKVQKDLYASNPNVGSLMISYNQWDAIMNYTQYKDGYRLITSYANYSSSEEKVTAADKSGSAYNGSPNEYDEAKNIYDLAGNIQEWTLGGASVGGRRSRGGDYYGGRSASYYYTMTPTYDTFYRF